MFCSSLCYLENSRGEYLMLHRVKKKQDVNQDKWIGVGGKFEAEESPVDCLLREVLEETGLQLTQFRFRGLITFLGQWQETEQMHLFTATGWTGTMKESCDEGVLKWVPRDQVLQLPIWAGDKIFFRLLEEERPPFLLKLRYTGDTLVEAVLDGQPLPLDE